MFEEVVPAIASALSAQGSELLVAGSRSAFKSLCEIIRARFGHGTPEADSLTAALENPGDAERIEAFARYLTRVMVEDPGFARQALAAWHGATASGSAEGSAVVNNFSGQAEQVVQARTIRGGIKF
ncbi:hypothetical protein [Paractinoplanes durhamensis]|uniref:Uncharacterized protein n=1 Tax=Paractinoplanes durhamensis TaxID=113563 RepID=A0ABQ3Z8P4_9ACTN|nr:hypothetical protein [Actinoplanes durhamensis]GIE06192.1 hypothetical protein Adu01nite_75420 [Actinoplanes durhamensis]